MRLSKITPCLWFDSQAEEAARFYVSVFGDGEIGSILRYATETPSRKPVGSVLTVEFTIAGQTFLAMNGGPFFKINEAVSFIVECENQTEIDYYWNKLSAVPEAEQCGWVKDRYGVSWQIVPKDINQLVGGDDPERARRAMEALLLMKKIDVAALKRATLGE